MVEDWIERWKTLQDEEAAEALYNHYHMRLYRLAYGLLGDGDDADDVMQETLRYALHNISLFDAQRAPFGAWLHTIAISRSRDKQRRKKSLLSTLGRFWQPEKPRSTLSPETMLATSQQNKSLVAAVQTLPLLQREVVVLRYWGGHSFPEIGRIVGKSEGTVKSRLRLAHQQLQRLVENPISRR